MALKDGEKAQILATLIQSQDNITWVAFSLAMTVESILLVGFFQVNWGLKAIAIAGLFLDIVFLTLVTRSNMDMRTLYDVAAKDFSDAFALDRRQRLQILGFQIRARYVMMLPFLAWLLGWLYLIAFEVVW